MYYAGKIKFFEHVGNSTFDSRLPAIDLLLALNDDIIIIRLLQTMVGAEISS
ncbi:hypothetical protein GF312_16355 [Candidatus Poribacteria bacterium]|nr:hypothetical protein [Candidatus Poribacteria bacterium]